ncbi:unnamed protein product [Rotaria magnacalcarata]|uniref:Uncharacterized protein n=1 Tax=Rotaria magnacalcarata TaxID=392030 RepID=A0A8S3C4T5_9BILA|nr:unnamed protein product [Rotaria magnacalcarata]CAF5126268.1 unnamed protein product [Rotaria magnacalcarata]
MSVHEEARLFMAPPSSSRFLQQQIPFNDSTQFNPNEHKYFPNNTNFPNDPNFPNNTNFIFHLNNKLFSK